MAIKFNIIDVNKIKEVFENLNDREQKLVTLAAVLVGFMFFYLILKNMTFIFSPSINPQAVNKRSEYVALQPKIKKLKELNQLNQNYQTINSNLYDFISKNPPTLTTLDEEQPIITDKNDQVEISYKAVSFDDLIIWLSQQQTSYGIAVISADIKRNQEQQGYVSAKIVLD